MDKKSKKIFLEILFSLISIYSFSQGGITVSSSSNEDTVTIEDSNSVRSEISATFMGGDINVFRDWVQTNLVYSPVAVKEKLQGRVIIKFSIDENGKLNSAEVYQGVHPLLDNEALRVIQSSPLWKPANLDGKNVKQTFIMPVIFILDRKFIKAHSN